MEGWAASHAIASALGVALPEPRPDPFAYAAAKKNWALASPEQESFQRRAMRLVIDGELARWARQATARRMTALGDVPEREAAERALDHALSTGALLFHVVYGVTLPPFASLVSAAEKAGAFRKPKRPSVAAMKKAFPPIAAVPFSMMREAPTRPGASMSNPTREAPCPWIDEAMPFVAQIDLSEVPGAKIDADERFFALFQSDTDARVIALPEPPTRGSVDQRLRALAFSRARQEPASAAWAKLVAPQLFTAKDDVHDEETKLGAYHAAVSDKTIASSKVGGFYAPVQGKLKLPPGTKSARLLFAIDFDDGARLPDAGLVYVFRVERENGKTELLVHCEHT
ncbi:MAG: hypothetical protein ACRELB_05140, partial [Polyangiaceae bacterium]